MEKQLTKYDRYRLKNLEAYRKRKREWAKTPEQRKKRTEYMRLWREKNRGKHNQQARNSHIRNRHKHADKNINRYLIKKYGITSEQKEQMFNSQNRKCLICKLTIEKRRSIHVDHCHITGEIRGILCHMCNTKLGWYEKHAESIKNYLNNYDKHKQRKM